MLISTNNSNSIYPKIRIIIFWISIIFIGIALFSLTVCQILPYELTDEGGFILGMIRLGLPIAVLMTLFKTYTKNNSKRKNLIVLLLTILISVLSIILQIFLIYLLGFGVWKTESIVYRHKTEQREIRHQLYTSDGFDFIDERIVELKPILYLWVLPTPIDTNTLDKSEWKFVDEEVDIKFP